MKPLCVTVADSLYCDEAEFCSHLDSYAHYLREHPGVSVAQWQIGSRRSFTFTNQFSPDLPDVLFQLDDYANPVADAPVKIAQVAAICNPMPWEVRKPDGSPVYDLVISSLRWMVGEARKTGCRAEWQQLAFDTRARACGMGVKRDIPLLFVGTRGPNHRKREEVLQALGDRVTIHPPTFGREYFRLLARAHSVLHVHAEWARGESNAMRLYEGTGMGCRVLTDGTFPPRGQLCAQPDEFLRVTDPDGWQWNAWNEGLANEAAGATMAHDTYTERIPQLVEWARELMEAKA